MLLFSECYFFSKPDIREVIELIEAKCISKAEIIELISDNPCQNGHNNELIAVRLIKAQDDLKEVTARLMAIDDCRDNPCQNGQCIDLENDYRCKCQSGYGGKNCDEKKCPVNKPGYDVVDGVCFL